MEALFGTSTAQVMYGVTIKQEVSAVDHPREPGTIQYDVQTLVPVPASVQPFREIRVASTGTIPAYRLLPQGPSVGPSASTVPCIKLAGASLIMIIWSEAIK